MKEKKIHLWRLLIKKGLFRTKEEASKWIMTGKVIVNDQCIDKNGFAVPEKASIKIKDYNKKYVSKGGLKLEGALRDFSIDVSGKVVLDAGASTGGFTDCLLQHGAKKVYAVDTGFGQLMGKLRSDKRVVNLEKTNISSLKKEQLIPLPSLAVVDLSYLSLKKAVPVIWNLMSENGRLICLVKPLFEIKDSTIPRTGKIEDARLYRYILSDLIAYFDNKNIRSIDITYSPVTGNKGTREFFLYLEQNKIHTHKRVIGKIDDVVESSLKLDLFKDDGTFYL